MTAGMVVLVVALLVGVLAGGVWRRTNGRMRNAVPAVPARTFAGAGAAPASAESPAPAGTVLAGTVLAGTGAAGLSLSSHDIGHPLGERATLLQFSTAFCAPCRATRRILGDVAGMTEGVTHVEIDAESRLDLVRQLNVLRTPTVLVLAGDGTILRRASGQPRKPDVIAAIGAAVDYNSHIYDRDRR
jgi:thiol-disulfide isomerase/thioredoxin